jgi:type IV pilus assembly protein PilA
MSEDGFTLIEFLVVTLIIGVLAAIALPAFLDQAHKARDVSVKSDLRNAVTQMESCFTEDESYAACTTPEATITDQTKTGYVATRVSETGTTFTITRAGRSTSRECVVPPGNDRGGCRPGGSW